MHLFSRFACAAAVALVCGLAATTPAHAQNLVTNGGFETGDFTGWTLTGNSGFISITSAAHSGNYAARFGAVGSDTFLSQTLNTTPGGLYSIRFFLANDGGTPNDFGVSFGGVNLFSATNLPVQPYTQYNFTGAATGDTTDLTFRFRQDPSFFRFDDVSVTARVAAVPEPGEIAAGAMLFGGLGIGMIKGRKRRLAA